MNGRKDEFDHEDRDLEQMLGAALAVSMDAAEPSPRVAAAVMRRIQGMPPGEKSPVNTLAAAAAMIMVAAFMGIRAWGVIISGLSYLTAGQVRYWGWGVVAYVLHGLWSAVNTILYLGLGEMFPVILTAVVSLGLLALIRPGHSGLRA